VTVMPVSDHPCQGGQQEGGDLTGKSDQSQQEHGIGHSVNQPGNRDLCIHVPMSEMLWPAKKSR